MTKKYLFTAMLFTLVLEHAIAAQIEPKGKAIAAILGTKNAFQKKYAHDGKEQSVFYSKDESGKAKIFAFVQEGLYPPNCTHTWIVGVDAKSESITEVRTVEMSCPHAFPTNEVSFLSQFVGKTVQDANALDKDIHVVAKATGSAKLAIDAVKKSLKSVSAVKGQI